MVNGEPRCRFAVTRFNRSDDCVVLIAGKIALSAELGGGGVIKGHAETGVVDQQAVERR